jgi:hypothetical protein
MRTIYAGQQILEKISAPAFDQQDACERWNASAEKVAQPLLFHVGQASGLPYSKKVETGVENPGNTGSSIV